MWRPSSDHTVDPPCFSPIPTLPNASAAQEISGRAACGCYCEPEHGPCSSSGYTVPQPP
jgi:hypothetical protein